MLNFEFPFKSPNSLVIYEASQHQWLGFHHPHRIITTHDPSQVMSALDDLQQAVQTHGYYAAGFVSYEAAPAFDPALKVRSSASFPLLWFGLFDPPTPVSLSPTTLLPTLSSLDWQPSLSPDQYRSAILHIKQQIEVGNTYQVNFSLRLHSPFTQDPWLLFQQLQQAQGGSYGAFINLPDWAICSASPELFFQLGDNQLISRPMKGTTQRGLTLAEDEQRALWLQSSVKNRAENVMIVDMVRNDLGQVAQSGTVRVTDLLKIERYPTLWQMTSTVGCITPASLSQIFQALFPAASITGAPKPSTMTLIADLEESPRRIYTGTIGLLMPQPKGQLTAQFNVAIRTVLIDKRQGRAEYGVGGGIVWDSDPGEEWQECQTKAKVLLRQPPDFCLLESLRWDSQMGYFLLEEHLQRLQASATYFAYPWEESLVRGELVRLVRTLPARPHKVRLLLAKDGTVTSQSQSLESERFIAYPAGGMTQSLPGSNDLPVRHVGLAKSGIDAANVFLYHKTTHRYVYEQAKQQAGSGYDDVLLWNDRREVTESCVANLVVEWAGAWYTPPVTCGLLAGTFRNYLLAHQKIQERVITLEDLARCDRCYLINSVRGWQLCRID